MAESKAKKEKDKDKEKSKNSKSSAKNSTKKTKADKEDNKKSAKKAGEDAVNKQKARSRMIDDVIGVFLVAFGIFLIMSVMTDATGEFGAVFSRILKGLFGHGAYIMPFFVIIYALLVLMRKMAQINARTVFFTILLYLDFVMLNSARFDSVRSETYSFQYIKEMFDSGVTLESGGAVGMAIAWPVVKFVDIAGLILIGIAVMVVCIMLIANTPISLFFERQKAKRIQKKAEAAAEAARLAEEQEQLAIEAAAAEEQLRIDLEKQAEIEKKAALEKKAAMDRQAKLESQMAAEKSVSDVREKKRFPFGKKQEPQQDIADLKIKNSEAFKNPASDFVPLDINGKPITENKRQILEYMNDEDLFNPDLKPAFPTDPIDLPEFTYIIRDEAPQPEPAQQPETPAADPVSESFAHSDAPESQPQPAETAGDFSQKLTKAEIREAVTAGAAAVGAEIETKKESDKKVYKLPSLSLLNSAKRSYNRNEEAELEMKAAKLEKVLHDFGVNAHVIDVQRGPSVTRYEIQPAVGVKVNSIVRLADDIALNLEAKSLRIEAPIPGKAAVGIEVENDSSSTVTIREMIDSQAFRDLKSKISMVIGKDIYGNPVIGDLKSMPHLLIAGSTGSGKSVCINSIIVSILYRSTPDEVKFILIDPKVVELGNYNGIPHMLIPVVTKPEKAAAALAWAVQEMNDRYRKFAETNVRDLKSYNDKMKNEGKEEEVLPQIVIIIDELADLMMAAAKQVEESICRLAQLARAAGMHMIVATQRPSVDVVTGLIKSNIPSRIAFAVSSQVDSRTILDKAGAEKLVGKGDMLYAPLGPGQPVRLQGPFVTDDEVNAVIDFWKEQAADEQSDAKKILDAIDSSMKVDILDDEEDEDELLQDAIDLIISAQQASASMLQRRFRIGYNRAGRLIDIMEARGIIGPSEGSKPRKVLYTKEEYYGASHYIEDEPEISEVPDEEPVVYVSEAYEGFESYDGFVSEKHLSDDDISMEMEGDRV